MASYTKLWGQILRSTIWREPNDMLVLWIAILALKDQDHIVLSSIPGLAGIAKISNEDCEGYLKKMESPDRFSSTEEFEGRRLKRVPGGWLVLNGAKYQDFMKEENRRSYVRKAVAKHRLKKKGAQPGRLMHPLPPIEPVEPDHVNTSRAEATL